MIVVETPIQLAEFESHFMEDCILCAIQSDEHVHPIVSKLSCLMVRFLQSKTDFILPFDHSEAVNLDMNTVTGKMSELSSKKYVFDKKEFCQICPRFIQQSIYDLNILKYLDDGSPVDLDEFNTNAHVFLNSRFYNFGNLNRTIPLLKHFEKFIKMCVKAEEIIIKTKADDSFFKLNNNLTGVLGKIESNGLYVNPESFQTHFGDKLKVHTNKENYVFTQYNIYTSTGRPSNRFGGINYAALNTEDGCRKSFVSRYGADGMLVLMDFSAFHPRLIAHLIRYDVPFSTDMYKFLGSLYFNKKEQDLTEDDVKKSKGLTFPQLYGGIRDEYLHIEYFKKTKEYIDHRWKFFENNGFIETPLYLRHIKPCHISDPNPNKLFNYILQSAETEYGCEMMQRVIDYLNGKLTKLILYTYDSILLDTHKSDGLDTLKEVRRLMENGQFPIKSKAGFNYHDMKSISI